MNFIKTHCQTIDDLLLGGFPLSRVSGLVSEPNVGKSQLIAQTSLTNKKSLIIETEGKDYDLMFEYLSKRFDIKNEVEVITILELEELLKYCGLDVSLETSKGGKVKTSMEVIKESNLYKRVKASNTSFVAIDSLSMPIKSYIEQKSENLPARATIENMLFGRLQWLAHKCECAVIITHHEQGINPINVWKKADAYGGPIVMYNTGYLLHLYDGTKALQKEYGEGVKRIKRERYIGKKESDIKLVDLREDWGYDEISIS